MIEAYQQGNVSDPQILNQLVSYYVRVSPDEAKRIYLGLFGTTSFENFNSDWLLGVANVFQQQQHFENVYLFTKANTLLTENQVNEEQLLSLIGGNHDLAKQLDQQAHIFINDLKSGNFANSASAALLLTPENIKD